MTHDILSISAFLYNEARLLDDRQWDEWLSLYAEDVEFWLPCWTDEDTLVESPTNAVSLLYYANRSGLEDRIFRIKTERSGASSPEPRTVHQISNIEILEQNTHQIKLRFNWHTMIYRFKKIEQFFGQSFYTVQINGQQPQIKNKKVILMNDYINQVLDIYHI
jgi:benzoate/toluate 1,2-dioxygenase beta subunit